MRTFFWTCAPTVLISWKQISNMLLVSRWTIRRRVVEYGLQEATGYSALSDERLDMYVKQFIEQHGTLVGCSMVHGCVNKE